MRAPSERVLRSSAWLVSLCLICMLIARAVFYFTEHSGLAFRWGAAVDAFGFALIIMLFPVTGALIVRRQPSNTMGWLLQGVGVIWLVGGAADNYARYGLLINPGALPGADIANVVNAGIWAPALGLMGTFVVLLYPNGHLPTPRWRPMAWLSGLTVVALTATLYLTPGRSSEAVDPTVPNPIGWDAAKEPLQVVMAVLLVAFPVCMVACAVGLVRRFRRSHGVERLQLKWLAAAGAIVACLLFLAIVVPFIARAVGLSTRSTKPWFGVLDTMSFLSFALLPAAIGVAILRHGLYEIDAIINRAVVYGFLTVTLACAYLSCVLLLQFLNPVTRQSDLAVAGSTLAVAALFRPARLRIQHVVDRRFYRSRYDAARTLDEFTGHLRHQVDINAVEAGLRRVVQDTVQPAHVSLWIRP